MSQAKKQQGDAQGNASGRGIGHDHTQDNEELRAGEHEHVDAHPQQTIAASPVTRDSRRLRLDDQGRLFSRLPSDTTSPIKKKKKKKPTRADRHAEMLRHASIQSSSIQLPDQDQELATTSRDKLSHEVAARSTQKISSPRPETSTSQSRLDRERRKELRMASGMSEGMMRSDGGSHRPSLQSSGSGRSFPHQSSDKELQMASGLSESMMSPDSRSHRSSLRSSGSGRSFPHQSSDKELQMASGLSESMVIPDSRSHLSSFRSSGSGRSLSHQSSNKELRMASGLSDSMMSSDSRAHLSSLRSSGSGRSLSHQSSDKELRMASGLSESMMSPDSSRSHLSSFRSSGSGRSFAHQASDKELQIALNASESNEDSFRLSSLRSNGSLGRSKANSYSELGELQQVPATLGDSSDLLRLASTRSVEVRRGEQNQVVTTRHDYSGNSQDFLRMASTRSTGPRLDRHHAQLGSHSTNGFQGQLSDRSMRNGTEAGVYGSAGTLPSYQTSGRLSEEPFFNTANATFHDEPNDRNNRHVPHSHASVLSIGVGPLANTAQVESPYDDIQQAPVSLATGPAGIMIGEASQKRAWRKKICLPVLVAVGIIIAGAAVGITFATQGRSKGTSISPAESPPSGVPTNSPAPTTISPTLSPTTLEPSQSHLPTISMSPTGRPWMSQARIEGASFGSSVQLIPDLLAFSNSSDILAYELVVDSGWMQVGQPLRGDLVRLSETRRILVRDALVVRVYDLVGGNQWSQVGEDITVPFFPESIAISGDGSTIAVAAVLPGGDQGRCQAFRLVGNRWDKYGRRVGTGVGTAEDYIGPYGAALSFDGNLLALSAHSATHDFTKVHEAPVVDFSGWIEDHHTQFAYSGGPAVIVSGDGRAVLTGATGKVRLYNSSAYSRVDEPVFESDSSGSFDSIPSLALTSDGSILAYASQNKLRVYEAVASDTWVSKREVPEFEFTIESISLSSDGRLAVGRPEENIIEVFE